jgi:hypothetical protein
MVSVFLPSNPLILNMLILAGASLVSALLCVQVYG